MARTAIIFWRESIIYSRDYAAHPRDWVIRPRDCVIRSRDSVIRPQDSVIHPRDCVIRPRDSVIHSREYAAHSRDWVIRPRVSIIDPRVQIGNSAAGAIFLAGKAAFSLANYLVLKEALVFSRVFFMLLMVSSAPMAGHFTPITTKKRRISEIPIFAHVEALFIFENFGFSTRIRVFEAKMQTNKAAIPAAQAFL